MASTFEHQPEDAATEEELNGGTPSKEATGKKPENAFTKLMAPKPKSSSPRPVKRLKASDAPSTYSNSPFNEVPSTTKMTSDRRDGLLEYILRPESFPASRVISHTDSWVLIRDMYPKSTVHLLLLPRNPEFYTQHPFRAFRNADFLAVARIEAQRAHNLAGSELRRLHGRHSASEKRRLEAMSADELPDDGELPAGRDWKKEVQVAVHAHPSMNHLHIHVLSRDMFSDGMKHRKHYNSFNTPFFVPLDDFPLAEDDPRWDPGEQEYLKRNFVCWRCGKDFGNQFAKLKKHLEMEFQEWRAE